MLSEKPWTVLATIRLFAMVIATLCLGFITTSLMELLKLGASDDQRHFFEMVVMGLSFQIGAIIWISIYVREAGTSWTQGFGFATGSRRGAIVLGLAVGFAFVPAGWLTQQACAKIMTWLNITPDPQAVVEELSRGGLGLAEKIFFGVLSIVLAPIAEESFFRGIIYPTVKLAGYPKTALWGTAILFGLFHFNAVTFVPLTLFGVALSLAYEKTDNLLTSMCAHSFFNTVNFFMLVYQDQLQDWLK